MAVRFAWLGGVAFVGSLGYLAYFYLVVLGLIAAGTADRLAPQCVGRHGALHRCSRCITRCSPARRQAVGQRASSLQPTERSVYVWVRQRCADCDVRPLAARARVVYQVDGWRRPAFWVLSGLRASVIDAVARGAA